MGHASKGIDSAADAFACFRNDYVETRYAQFARCCDSRSSGSNDQNVGISFHLSKPSENYIHGLKLRTNPWLCSV